MLAPIGDVLGVARQGSEHLPVAVGKPHALGMTRYLPCCLARQSAYATAGSAYHRRQHWPRTAGSRRFIPAAQHEELITAGITPVPLPLLMARIAVGLEVMLLTPQPFRPEAQPHPARRNVGLQVPPAGTSNWPADAASREPAATDPVPRPAQPAVPLEQFAAPSCPPAASAPPAPPTPCPSSDTRTALNIRAGIPYSRM